MNCGNGEMIRIFHRMTISVIRLMPPSMAIFAFRILNKITKWMGAEYRAETYFKARLFCNPGDSLQMMILHFGVWEPNISHVIEQNLAPGDVFVDVGANIGYDTLLASSLVGPTGKVVAIEASPGTFSLLTRNLALNKAGNVRPVNAAVSDQRGKLNLYSVSQYNIGAVTTLASRGGKLEVAIDALPLDEILTREEISSVRLIKMDVEGAEALILQNILDRISMYPPSMDIIVEVSPDDGETVLSMIFDRFRSYGFSAYEIANPYDLDSYLKWKAPAPPAKIDRLPPRQADILFTRKALAH